MLLGILADVGLIVKSIFWGCFWGVSGCLSVGGILAYILILVNGCLGWFWGNLAILSHNCDLILSIFGFI